MKVLHLFQEYLPLSQTWLFNLLSNTKQTENWIGPIFYSAKPYPHNERFNYVKHYNQDTLQKYCNHPFDLNFFYRKIISFKRKFIKSEIISIRNWIMSNDPDLIHVHFGTTAVHFLPILKEVKIPFIVSFYGYDYYQPELKLGYKEIFSKAIKILVEEQSGIKKLKDQGCLLDKIAIQRLGVNIRSIDYRKPKGRKKLRFVQIANFKQKKGQLELVNMVDKYRSKLEGNCCFTLIGEYKSEYGAEVLKRIKEKKLDLFFSIMDSIPYNRIHDFLNEYDVFIHPSRYGDNGDSEGGAPTILLDAQAVGLPVVSTNHCDIPNYVPKENHDLLAREKDIDSLFEKVMLCFDEDLTGKSKFGRLHVENNFDIVENSLLLEKIYTDLSKYTL